MGALSLLLLVFAGCTTWNHDKTAGANSPKRLPGSELPDSRKTILAVAILEYRDEEWTEIEKIWRESDHQFLPLVDRRCLDSNGIRIAVTPSGISENTGKLLDTELSAIADALPHLADQIDLEGTPGRSRYRGMQMTFQPGVPREIPVSGLLESVNWEVSEGDMISRGNSATAVAVVQIELISIRDSIATLRLTPGFREQLQRPEFGIGGNGFELASQQVFHKLDSLVVDLPLGANQTLLVGPTRDWMTSNRYDTLPGRLFFGNPPGQEYNGLRRMLLVNAQQIGIPRK